MTLNELITKHNFITKIAFKGDDEEMKKDLKVKIMTMRIEMGKIRKQFEEDSREAAEGLMPEGYKELAQKQDKSEAEKVVFDKQTQELNDAYREYVIKKGQEEVTGKHITDTFTEDEFEEIVATNGGLEVDINGTKLSGPDFLEVINSLFS